jgi:hypothetical protein
MNEPTPDELYDAMQVLKRAGDMTCTSFAFQLAAHSASESNADLVKIVVNDKRGLPTGMMLYSSDLKTIRRILALLCKIQAEEDAQEAATVP